jgi:Protein of unknown function (DUF4058)
MAGPFPGMDPFLEKPGFWQGFHNSFIAFINSEINRVLPGRFIARSEARIVIDRGDDKKPSRPVPDVTVFAVARNAPRARGGIATATSPTSPEEILLETRREAFIEILDRASGNQVVMVIELLSPENKQGKGQEEYQRKQQAILQSQAHLLEIDLLRSGVHTVAAPREGALALGSYSYLLSLANAQEPNKILLWRIGLADRLPTLELPLTADVPPFTLDLQAVFDRCYDENRYAELLEVAYTQPAEPAFTDDEAAWAQECLEGYVVS